MRIDRNPALIKAQALSRHRLYKGTGSIKAQALLRRLETWVSGEFSGHSTMILMLNVNTNTDEGISICTLVLVTQVLLCW